jgi:hypothetical protein
VTNSIFHDFAHAGVKGGNWKLIDNNKIYNIGKTRYDHGLYIWTNGDTTLSNNYIFNISGYGIHGYSDFNGSVISGNVIKNIGTAPEDPQDGSSILVNGNNNTIRNNVGNGGDSCITLFGDSRSGNRVENNICLNMRQPDLIISRPDMMVSGNVFTNNVFASSVVCRGCEYGATSFDDVPPNSTTLPSSIPEYPSTMPGGEPIQTVSVPVPVVPATPVVQPVSQPSITSPTPQQPQQTYQPVQQVVSTYTPVITPTVSVPVQTTINPVISPVVLPKTNKLVKTLKFGMTSEDVKRLQIVLNKDPYTRVSTTGLGSPGKESTYFGTKTLIAVKKFQQKYSSYILTPNGLKKPNGIVGKSTLDMINEIGGY